MGRGVSFLLCLVCLAAAPPLRAQEPAAPPAPASGGLPSGFRLGRCNLNTSEPGRWRCEGQVELELQGGTRFSADQVDYYLETNRLEASGNVVFQGPEAQIAAERVEFDVGAGTGTFHMASGFIRLGDGADLTQFGNQEPDYIFTGELIEKLGARRYRITRGTITACVQPTPRWQMVTGSATLNLDDYAIARNAVLRVKGVPLMYLPVIYYPIQEDERATGFLMPTYGTSTLRGQALSNAFFWAMGRSHDATLFHDWFTRAGQGAGVEYRYIANDQSSGEVRFYRFDQQEQEYVVGDSVNILPENTSFEISAVASHTLSRSIRTRARIDYFSDIVSQQLYHQNVYQASRSNRVIEASLTAGLGAVSASVLYQRNEVFNNATSTQVYGSTPRVNVSMAPQRLFSAPVYGSVNAEYAYLPYRSIDGDIVTRDDSLNRLDVTPTVRVPLSRLTFLTVNTSAAYRATHYSRQYDPVLQTTVPGAFLRDYIALRSDIVGPVFTRIWDLAEGSFAERLKHVIEPTFTVDFTSQMQDYRRTPALSDTSDVVVGGATRVTYGVTNRLFSRGGAVDGRRGQTREFVTLGIQQTYYSNPEGSQYDLTYRSAQGGRLVDLSPVALNLRVSPSAAIDGTARVEYDVSGRGLQAVTTGANLSFTTASMNLNYSHFRRDRSSSADDYLSSSANLRFLQNRATGTYSLSWDIARSYIVSQSVMASYMAQCCGLQVEYQTVNFPQTTGIPIPSDRRFNFGFVLSGLGTFSNFFGAFGGRQ
jgi:LPS-assembly protein